MHPWTAAALTRTVIDPGELGHRHRHAVDTHLRRFKLGRAGYQDLVDLARHLAGLNRYDDVAALASQATEVLPGSLARASYLADIRPLLPPGQRTAMLVADLELQAVLDAGNLVAAHRLARDLFHQAERLAAADPTNTGWQRDLSVSRDNLGDVAAAAGDQAGAAEHYRAGLAIRERLAAADPTNTGWQRDLSVSRERLGNLAVAAGDLAGAAEHLSGRAGDRPPFD
jgi:hypothetical protein